MSNQHNTKTPAMVLQELTVKLSISPPEYNLVLSKMGTHENEFHYVVYVAGIEARGFGRSKQVAKHDAATRALEQLAIEGLYDSTRNPAQVFNAQSHRNESGSPLKTVVNYIGSLQELCAENKLPPPKFIEISDVGPPHAREFTYECRVASIMTQMTANTKKQAKQLAARDLLERVRDICPKLIEQVAAEATSLMAIDETALSAYKGLGAKSMQVVPNRSVEVKNFPYTLQKIMLEKGHKFTDFKLQFQKRDYESLEFLLACLEVTFEVITLQTTPYLLMIVLHIDTPFTLMAFGDDETKARSALMQDTFETLEVFLTANMEDSPVL